MTESKAKASAVASAPGFTPIPYQLDWERILEVPARISLGGGETSPTTVGAVLREAMPGWFLNPGEPEQERAPIPSIEAGWALVIKKHDGSEIRVDRMGEGRSGATLIESVMQFLQATKDNGHYGTLYYYARDCWHLGDTSGDRYKFFIVAGGKILDEGFELSSVGADRLEWRVLKACDTEDRGYRSGADAQVNFWYRRFYTETQTGQLMVLRNDGSPIFRYSAPEHLEAERLGHLRSISARMARLELIALVLLATAIVWLLRGCLEAR